MILPSSVHPAEPFYLLGMGVLSRKLGSLAGLHESLRKVYSALTLLPGVEISHRTRKELLPGEIVLCTRIVSLHRGRLGLPLWPNGKEPACQYRKFRFDLWVRKIPGRRKWQPTPVLLPGKSHGQRSLAGYIPWGRKESDTTENARTHACTHTRMGGRLKLF